MNKLISILLVALCLIATSCSDNTITELNENVQQVSNQILSDSQETASTKTPLTIDLSEGISEDKLKFSGSYDFDYDNTEETVSMEVYLAPGNDWDGSYITINMGAYSQKLEMIGGTIEAVYACDIDPDDGLADLALITCEVSGDPRIRILKYKREQELYPFYDDFLEEVANDHWLGYAVNYYFNVNEDGTLTLEEQTNNRGMWSVYRTYSRDDQGVFREIKQEKYNILPDFMENNYCINSNSGAYISGEEFDMWKKAYIKAYTTYTDNGFTINEGEYFKVIQDDDNSKIYVEKEDGSAAWINTHYDTFPGENLNRYFFYMAG